MSQNLDQLRAKCLIILLVIEGDGTASVANASSTSNAVDIVINFLGQVIIDDQVNPLDVCNHS